MSDNSIDFIVTDPPYGLKFMGKKWDHGIPGVEFWAEMLRICKPGSMLAAFGGTRTYHRLACAVEDEGWQIRDCIMWLYGSGFPKSLNKFGLDGYGTALKPAFEPILIAMKPLQGTYSQNVEKFGLGGINIKDCGIETRENLGQNRENKNLLSPFGVKDGSTIREGASTQYGIPIEEQRRWPANIILDEQAAQALDQQSGITQSKSGGRRGNNANLFQGMLDHDRGGHNDFGGASRFFYCAKTSKKEREEGLEHFEAIERVNGNKWTDQDYRQEHAHETRPRKNIHPTVKPISLMKYLITLLAPPSSPVLLDPFMGSGSTLMAAKSLGIRAIGIEKDSDYFEIAKARIENCKAEEQKNEN